MNISAVMTRFAWAAGVSMLGLLFAAAPTAIAAGPAPAANSIEAISVSAANSGLMVVKISMNQPVAAPPAGIALNNPARVYFDFPNTSNALGKNTQDVGEGELRSINIVQAGNRTRLVMNLSRPLTYDTRIEGKTLLITLQGAAATAAAGSAAHFAEARPGTQKLSVRDVDFRRGPGGEGRVQVDLSDAGAGIDLRQSGKSIIVEFLKTSLPRNLERRLDVVDFATPVQTIETYTQGENVRMVIEPKGLWEHSAYQTDTKFILEVKPVTEDPNKINAGRPGYTGDKLSLNFQNVEVRAVLQVIADFTGLNIITSDTVSGNLTLRLKDVPWDQALDIILQSKGLDMRKIGNVVLIAPRDEIATKEKLDLESRQQISDLEPTRTESFQLNYQKADAMKALLGDANQKMLTKRGSVVVDARTNTLFVKDTPTQLEEIRRLIRKIDVPVRQVMIEARIVDATDNFSRNLGARFGIQAAGGGGPFRSGISGNAESSSAIAGGAAPAGAGNLNVNLPVAAAGSLGITLIKIANGNLVNLELSALESDGRGKVISSPRVVTADQVEATIEQGTDIPYQQATSSGATSVSFKKASLSLKVTPQITPDDNIIMKLNVNQDTVGVNTIAGPSINTKQINTQVLVENGGTVVIGGIFTRDENTSVTKVPLLGDIPVVGYLFKQTFRKDEKRELLIFVTPRVLKDSLNLR